MKSIENKRLFGNRAWAARNIYEDHEVRITGPRHLRPRIARQPAGKQENYRECGGGRILQGQVGDGMVWGLQVRSKKVRCLVYLITVMCVNCLGDGRSIARAGTRIMSRWGLYLFSSW